MMAMTLNREVVHGCWVYQSSPQVAHRLQDSCQVIGRISSLQSAKGKWQQLARCTATAVVRVVVGIPSPTTFVSWQYILRIPLLIFPYSRATAENKEFVSDAPSTTGGKTSSSAIW